MVKLRNLFIVVLTLMCNVYAFSQLEDDGGTTFEPTFQPGAPSRTPIDMYEGALMIVATSMIAGYYFVRNRRQTN